jgi:hypothetical protein
MRSALSAAIVLALAGPVAAQPKTAALTPQEVADGWLMLFDGESTFGWKAEGYGSGKKAELAVRDGVLVLDGAETQLEPTSRFPQFELVAEYRSSAPKGNVGIAGTTTGVSLSIDKRLPDGPNWHTLTAYVRPNAAGLVVDGREIEAANSWLNPSFNRVLFSLGSGAGGRIEFRSVKLRPTGTTSLFNGKDLTGWKVFGGDPKRVATKFEVTKDGELSAKNGPGDLQTEKAYGNFLFQMECKTNGKWLNSGVFFRCMPEQYQNGYEAQIQNAYLGDDRTKPIDFGTGAIYRRIAARKVVSNDNEWFTLTVLADGPRIATWVNGYQTVDWLDDRKQNDNPRQGLRTAPGHLSIQGHDPTTDLLFRRIRIAEMGNR